ncbi:MAG: hypothetical protein A4E60_00236 [Syntrophorhabdus sp. PtaB.Bin047]|jgi:hypothetical protein|nr:MAG: hypothetical protein A4E60_00236 [Syntrophorhabdus sp. PtaB.Bin047]
MEIKTVRNALINTLKTNPDIISKIGADKVGYGLGRNINKNMLPRSIRVVQLGRGGTGTEAEEAADFGGGTEYVWAKYRFHVVVVFQLVEGEDEKDAEDYESDYDRIVRKAISANCTLGSVVTDIELGRTLIRQLPEKDTIYFVLLEVNALSYESTTER